MKKSFIILLFIGITIPVFSQKKFGLKNLSWLQGKWQSEKNPLDYEEWYLKGEELRGVGYSVGNDGSLDYHEELRIFSMKDTLYYGADISGPQKEILFQIKKPKKKKVEFINPKHDFPQSILYTRKGKKKVIVSLSGVDEKGEVKTLFLYFKKVN